MQYFTGLDISLETTAVCIVNETGKIMKEMMVETSPQVIMSAIVQTQLPIKLAGLECGGISHWLVKELKKMELPIICIDARKMSAAISIRANKTDKNDAREIANALRTGYFKEVYQKQDHIVEKQTLLTARRSLIEQRTRTIGCIRGLLKMHGKLKCGSSQNPAKFVKQILDEAKDLGEDIQLSISSLVNVYQVLCSETHRINGRIAKIIGADEDVKRFMTIPGVGPVTALTFKLEIDDPSRFKKSRSVGAYVGMTPRQHSSGETKRQGSISKMGSSELRSLLTESALCLMYNARAWSRLKVFGLKIKKKHGHKKAVVALGRKLAVVMHRMWIDGKAFEYREVSQKEIEKLQTKNKHEKKDSKKQTLEKVAA